MKFTYADMHCDSLPRAIFNGNKSFYDGEGMQSIKKQVAAGQILQFYAIFFPPKTFELPGQLSDEEYYSRCKDALAEQIGNHTDKIAMAYSHDDVIKNWNEGKVSAMLTLEDGRMVNGSFTQLEQFYRDGVRAIALTWNFENCFGCPNSTNPEIMNKGLTPFGIEAVKLMQELGMLVDVSHLSDGGFYDVLKNTKLPFIASHSNCRALTNHPRNLTDDMIRALAKRGGIAGLNFAPEFTRLDPKSNSTTKENLAAHLEHMYKIGGEDFPAIGTDFDGISGDIELNEPQKLDVLFELLEKKGFSPRLIEKFAFKNVLRVLKEAVK